MAVPYTFGAATAAIPLSQLDSNFASTITLGNTAIQLGNTVTILNNMTFANVTVSSGTVTLTSANVTTANVTTLITTNDATINGLTVGKGAGAVATNTAVGASALAANTTGSINSAFGYQAGFSLTTGTFNNFFGENAAYYQTTGSYNIAIGQGALQGVSGQSNTGSNNTAIGHNALLNNTTASNNTAVGYQAGYTNSTGQYNTFIGTSAGNLTTGGNNQFIGNGAGRSVTSGSGNSIIGNYSGNQGGLDIRTLSNYIVLSDGDGNPRVYSYSSSGGCILAMQGQTSTTYGLLVARNSSGTDAGYLTMGQQNGPGSTYDHVWALVNNAGARMYVQNISAGVYLSQGGTSWTSNSDERLKTDLQPIENAAQKVSTLRAVTGRFIADDEAVSRAFLIAQDVQAVLPQAVDASDPEKLGVQYSDVIPLLVAAIKELKAELDAYKEAHP
jgi:hypothetical protein